MTVYDNTNRGALFTNSRKKSDKHPDLTGNIDVDGKEYWLSAWRKVSNSGEKYLSISIRAKEDGGQQQQKRSKSEPPPFDADDPLF